VPAFLTWATSEATLSDAMQLGALGEIESVLRVAYDLTESSPEGRLRPSRVVEHELKRAGWKKTRPWLPEGFSARDSFDGWKEFVDKTGESKGVAVEIQWVWPGIYNDLLKFWRAARGGQAAFGIEVLRGPDSFHYVVHHVFAFYREVFRDVHVVFCALDAPDLHERFPKPLVHETEISQPDAER
jgi:hypothetical protein